MHGFTNIGHTCYFNSAVQCLMHMNLELSEGEGFTRAYNELAKLYFTHEKCLDINIAPLLKEFQEKFPRFVIDEPHDAQEALFCMIDMLPGANKQICGEKIQETIWPGGKKKTVVPYSVCILDVGEDKKVSEILKKSEEWSTLSDYVDDDGAKYNIATTRSVFKTFPKTLIISFNHKSRVEADEINNYELKSSIVHINGHYMTFIKLNDNWILANDGKLSIVDFPIEFTHHVLVYNQKSR